MTRKFTLWALLLVFVLGLSSGISLGAKKEITLRYVSWMTKGEDRPFIEEFMKENPGIKVEVEALDGANYDMLLKTRILSGDAPDVFLIQWPQYYRFVKEGYLMDVSRQPGMSLLAKTPSINGAFLVNGKRYGFPVNTQGGPIPIYYNKKFFAKLGITPPRTLNELWSVCDKIKAAGVEPFVFGDKDKWPFEYFFRARHYAGILPTNQEWGLSLAKGDMKASEMFKNEYQMAELMVQKGYITKSSLTLTWPQSVPYFISGRAAMLPQGPWVPGLPEIKAADPAKFELACFTSPLETVKGKKYAMGEIDRSIVLSATTKYPAAAKKLYNWFIAPQHLKKYLESQSLVTFLNLDYKIDPVIAAHFKSLSAKDFVIIMRQKAAMAPGFITESVWDGFQSILAGSSAETELKKLDAEFEKTKAGIVITE